MQGGGKCRWSRSGPPFMAQPPQCLSSCFLWQYQGNTLHIKHIWIDVGAIGPNNGAGIWIDPYLTEKRRIF